jgi:DNA-binding transcriptional LysR family regulator
MELRHLRYFVAVAEAENFHRAAEKLHVSQSPLSRQMQQLKAEVGVDLFQPAGRGIELTLAGRMFLERAKAILSSVNAAVEEAQEATSGKIGTIAIGFGPGATYAGALSTIVAEFRRRRPRVNVKLVPMTSPDQWDALRLGEIAFAYGNYAPEDSSLRSVVLARTRIGILLPSDHRLAKKPKLKVADLASESILMAPRSQHPRMHDDIVAAVRARGVVLNMAPEILDREALWTLVASGLGLTFAGERTASFLNLGAEGGGPGSHQLGSAVWRPLSDLGVDLCDVAMWRSDAPRSPMLRPLIDIISELRSQLKRAERPGKGRASRGTP